MPLGFWNDQVCGAESGNARLPVAKKPAIAVYSCCGGWEGGNKMVAGRMCLTDKYFRPRYLAGCKRDEAKPPSLRSHGGARTALPVMSRVMLQPIPQILPSPPWRF